MRFRSACRFTILLKLMFCGVLLTPSVQALERWLNNAIEAGKKVNVDPDAKSIVLFEHHYLTFPSNRECVRDVQVVQKILSADDNYESTLREYTADWREVSRRKIFIRSLPIGSREYMMICCYW